MIDKAEDNNNGNYYEPRGSENNKTDLEESEDVPFPWLWWCLGLDFLDIVDPQTSDTGEDINSEFHFLHFPIDLFSLGPKRNKFG